MYFLDYKIIGNLPNLKKNKDEAKVVSRKS